MKTFKKFLLFLTIMTATMGTAQETITNESVVQMVELGFDDYMIIDKINTSDVKFDASISALIEPKMREFLLKSFRIYE